MPDTDNAPAQEKPAEAAKPDPKPAAKAEPEAKEKPGPADIAKALDNDVLLLLDAVITAAAHEDLRKCPALANICQSYQINRQSMVDWLERTRFRQEMREKQREETKAAEKAENA